MAPIIPRSPSLAGIEDLRRGYTPSTHEARKLIEENTKQLLSEQELIDAELERLSARRRDISRELEINQALLAPVRKLFPELLSEVFKHAVQGSSTWTRFSLCVLCGVCTTWRAAARDTPLLWTSIDLDYIIDMDDPILHLQVQLSAQLPLRVYRWRNSTAGRISPEAFFDALSDTDASRVEEIEIEYSGDKLSKMRARNFSRLLVAEVSIVDSCASGALGFLASAPALRDLCIAVGYPCSNDEVLLGSPVPAVPIFQCVTRLTLGINNDLPVSAFVSVLSQLAPTLNDLIIVSNEVSNWEEAERAVTFEMPVLCTVELEAYTHKVLTYITAPVLHTVTLNGDDLCLAEEDPTESLFDLLSRSRPPLRSFTLRDPMQGSADTLLNCIERMAGLQRLCMEDNKYRATSSPRMVAVLEQLICDDKKPPMLPELRSLSVQFEGRYRVSSHGRADVVAPLSQVRLSRKEPRVCAGQAVVALEEYNGPAL